MSAKLIVSKFGGSSVKDANSMLLCADLVKKIEAPSIVIISATWNTSNLLEDIARASIKGDVDYLDHQFQLLKERHDSIAKDLNIYGKLKNILEDLYEEALDYSNRLKENRKFSPRIMAAMYSIGERLSSQLFTFCLTKYVGESKNPIYLDIRDVLQTDSNFLLANPNMFKTRELVDEKLKKNLVGNNIIVTQGFIGMDEDGRTTTLGREGSDYTGAIIASMICAREYHIWTDVNGVKRCDPRLVPEAETIESLSYDDAELFAKLGAKVLFPRTIGPARSSMIPIFVGSTKEPNAGGTWIRDKVNHSKSIIGFALTRDDGGTLSVVGDKAGQIDLSKEVEGLELISKNTTYVSYKPCGDINYSKIYNLLKEVD